jgi:hypothetical protein
MVCSLSFRGNCFHSRDVETGEMVTSEKTAAKHDSSERREIEAMFTRLVEHVNSIRGSVQVIKQKSQISTSSQKVVETWSQELKDITRKRGSRKSSANGNDLSSKAPTGNAKMQPRGQKCLPLNLSSHVISSRSRSFHPPGASLQNPAGYRWWGL